MKHILLFLSLCLSPQLFASSHDDTGFTLGDCTAEKIEVIKAGRSYPAVFIRLYETDKRVDVYIPNKSLRTTLSVSEAQLEGLKQLRDQEWADAKSFLCKIFLFTLVTGLMAS